jgi:hypothetical protein
MTFGTLLAATSANAGVSSIRSNDNISGIASYLVQYSSGSDYVIYKKIALGIVAVADIWVINITIGQKVTLLITFVVKLDC